MSQHGARPGDLHAVKKTRLTSGQACTNCRRKKHKCDGKKPECGGCASRGIGCNYPSASLSRSSIEELETLLAAHRNERALTAPENSRSAHSSRLVDPPAGSPSGTSEFFGDSSTFKLLSQLEQKKSSSSTRIPALQFSSTAPEPGQTAYEFPSRALADQLVDAYFQRVHIFYPFLHEGSFRTEYEQVWTQGAHRSVKDGSIADAILHLVFAYGCEFVDAAPDQDIFDKAAPYIAYARDLILSQVFSTADLSLVQALLLLSHYLQGTLQLNECWSFVGLMVRSAISIGLHRPVRGDLEMHATEREMRKRVWWGCFILDRTLSMKFGRPPCMNVQDVDTVEFPLDVDDQYITNASTTPRQPWGRASTMSFFIHTIKLAFVIDRILSDLYLDKGDSQRSTGNETSQRLNCPPDFLLIGKIVRLDGILQHWWDSRPAAMMTESTATKDITFQRQRCVLLIRHINMRILLQRASLVHLGHQCSRNDFLRDISASSAGTCFSAAAQCIKLINEQYKDSLLNSIWYNLHYVFTAIGVLLYMQFMERRNIESFDRAMNHEALESGMQFLRMASRSSRLAARYLSTLEVVLQARTLEPHEIRNGDRTAEMQRNNDIAETTDIDLDTPSFMAGDPNQFGSIDFNTNDLLYGTGLPFDLLQTDWSNYGQF